MHHRQDWQMVIRAVQMAVWQHQDSHTVTLHSDHATKGRQARPEVLSPFTIVRDFGI
jgi:hypothetical protein